VIGWGERYKVKSKRWEVHMASNRSQAQAEVLWDQITDRKGMKVPPQHAVDLIARALDEAFHEGCEHERDIALIQRAVAAKSESKFGASDTTGKGE
jgi:hypothetical protein